MLTHIRITRFAIIDELDIELSDGLTVITGETGAGKSIMIDAIGLVLGDRADASAVKHGATRAEITLTLDVDQPHLQKWLEEHDLEAGDECLLRRVITAEGRSRSYINGSPATLTMLREFGEQLVDIHGQHAHQSLRTNAAQRALLDAHGNLGSLAADVAKHYHSWHSAETTWRAALEGDEERHAKIDLLTFQVNELDQLAMQENELQTLDEELAQLANADQLKATTSECLQQLYDSEDANLYQQLGNLLNRVTTASELTPRFSEVADLLNQAQIQVDEAVTLLRSLDDTFEANPERLNQVEQRLGQIYDLARKHHVEPDNLIDQFESLQAELNSITGPETSLESLEAAAKNAADKYDALADKLRESRQQTADKLNRQITAAMQELGMDGGRFEARLEPLSEGERKASGTEDIQFMVTANPGQPPQPLTKVASGGELSRISLAIQLAASRKTRVPTMIFDEVDSGVGGAVAEVVGRQLQALGKEAQVFCVTHLPQVAACGHHHLQVTKQKDSDQTSTRMVQLPSPERVEELARMLGGKTITEQTRRHAEEMLNQSGA